MLESLFRDNPYKNGIQYSIPDEYSDDFYTEFERANKLKDPLLMFILQRTAQEGFKTGPIGSDGYFEHYDPELNENERENFTNFMDAYYPDAENAYYELSEPSSMDRLRQNPEKMQQYDALKRALMYKENIYSDEEFNPYED